MIYKSIERSQAYVAALALAQVFQKSDDHFKLFKKVSRLAYGSDDSERVPFNDAQLTIWKKEIQPIVSSQQKTAKNSRYERTTNIKKVA